MTPSKKTMKKVKRIPLRDRRGKVKKWAIVDSDDYPALSQSRWFATKNGYTYYACRTRRVGEEGGAKSTILMHRVVNKTPQHLIVDHINGNGLDNRKNNLRNCTFGDNQNNRRIGKNNTSGFPRVRWRENEKRWVAVRRVAGHIYFLGGFAAKRDAIKAIVDFQELHNLPRNRK